MHNQDQIFDLGFSQEYKINELIFINSGANYYARLPVNQHSVLIAPNNGGKTSSLSAIKLFMLPEINFKKQKDKFGFQSGGEYYDDIMSFKFYFPDVESYIICNASNPRGSFCWILYRSTKLEFHRIAIPHDYEAIEHLFWNSESELNERAGCLQPNIASTTLKKVLLTKYDGTLFTDKKLIGEALYTRASETEDNTKFCLFPMIKGYSAGKAETMKALLNIAFDLSNASTESLPKAIGAILDSQGLSAVKKNNSEGILIDLDSQLEEWRKLKADSIHIGLLESHKDTFDRLSSNRNKHAEIKAQLVDLFKSYVWSMVNCERELTGKLKQLQEDVTKSSDAVKSAKDSFTEINNKFRNTKAQLKVTGDVLQDVESDLEAIRLCRRRLGPMCPDGKRTDECMLQLLDEEIRDCEDSIRSLEDAEIAAKNAERLNQQIKLNQSNATTIKNFIEQIESSTSFLDAIPPTPACVLMSLSDAFGVVSNPPSLKDSQIIESFTGLFDVKDCAIEFLGETLEGVEPKPYDKHQTITNHRKSYDEILEQIAKDKEKLIEITGYEKQSVEQRQYKLQEEKSELATYQKEKDALKGASLLEGQRNTAEIKVKKLRVEMEAELEEFQIEEERKNETVRKFNNDKLGLERINGPLSDISNLKSLYRNIEAQSHRILSIEQATYEFGRDEFELRSPNELKKSIDELNLLLANVNKLREECISDMGLLLRYGVIDSSPEEQNSVTTDQAAFTEMFGAMQAQFFNLEQTKEKYKETLLAHNNEAAAVARIIGNIQGIVENFIEGINQEIHVYQISNLTSVTLQVDLHSEYIDMIKTLNRIGARTDQLMDETFYKQIGSFQENFYNKKAGKVDIGKIIQRVRYKFIRGGISEDVPQSNGTNSMINSVLLALLFKRLTPGDLRLCMPVIFDEVGKLDKGNQKETLKVMDEHDLFLFVANPELNGSIAGVFSVFHNLDMFRATDSEIVNKAEHIYYPGLEDRIEDIEESQEEETAPDLETAH